MKHLVRAASLLLATAVTGAAHAQSYPPPSYPAPPPAEIVVPGPPPPPRFEAVPPPPPRFARRAAWQPGHWRWNRHRQVWAWVPGRYVERPRHAVLWEAGHWVQRPHGWVWVPGHWR
jgi:hypothetical protein